MTANYLNTVSDDLDSLCRAVLDALKTNDIVITTGGVSAGDFDYMPEVIRRIGGDLLFHRLKFKPGGAMLGAWTNAMLENIHPDIAIIGTDACTPTGPMVTPYEEVTVKRNIFSVSQKTILLADSTKFEKTAAFLVCDWDDIDVLVTDSNVSQDVLEEYQNRVMITVADRDLT